MRQKRQLTTASKVNYNLGTLIKEFGFGSDVVKAAQNYIESRTDKSFIKYNKKNEIVGIKQKKDLPEEIFGRSWVFDQYLSSATDMYNREIDDMRETIKEKRDKLGVALTPEEEKILDSSNAQIKKNKALKQKVRLSIESVYANMLDMDDLVNKLYNIINDTGELEYDAYIYINDAQYLLDRRETTAEWVREAQELVRSYTEAVEREERLNT